MKTTSFGSISVVFPEDSPEVVLRMKVPGEEALELPLSPDELMLFLVELGNGLATSRKEELKELKARELIREMRRVN